MSFKCKNIIRVEVLWDYDWILYHKCKDCWLMKNVHTWVVFDSTKSRWGFTPIYQYRNGELVGYSTGKAEWLSFDDDINEWGNLLWGWRWIDWKEEILFKPIKSLSNEHIKSILSWGHTKDTEYIMALKEQLDIRLDK